MQLVSIISELGLSLFRPTCILTSSRFNLVGPMWADLPNYLEKHKYQDMIDSNDTCWHSANKTEEHVFSWMGRHPDVAANFGQWMGQYMQGQKTWLESFPLEKEVGSWKAKSGDDVLLVDVGGNVGPLLDSLVAKTAGIEGRIVLQELPKDSNLRSGADQPHDTEAAAEKPAVETTVHDINTPQPVKSKYDSRIDFKRNSSVDYHRCKILLHTKCIPRFPR